MADSPVLTDARDTAETAARAAAEQLRRLHRPLAVGRDVDPTAVVVEAEYAAEDAITRPVLDAFPAHTVVIEEDVVHRGTGPYTWLVDPLDGTDSFRGGDGGFAVS